MVNISEIIKSAATVIVDVRTPGEFMGGHVAGSINIPLNEIPGRIDELKKMGHLYYAVPQAAAAGRLPNS